MKIPASAGGIPRAVVAACLLAASLPGASPGAFAQMAIPAPAAPVGQRVRVRVCLNQSDTRATIVADKLVEPFHAMRDAAQRVGAEGVASRLCRWNETYVYEITLLRADGRIIHVFMDATNGSVVGARNDH